MDKYFNPLATAYELEKIYRKELALFDNTLRELEDGERARLVHVNGLLDIIHNQIIYLEDEIIKNAPKWNLL